MVSDILAGIVWAQTVTITGSLSIFSSHKQWVCCMEREQLDSNGEKMASSVSDRSRLYSHAKLHQFLNLSSQPVFDAWVPLFNQKHESSLASSSWSNSSVLCNISGYLYVQFRLCTCRSESTAAPTLLTRR